MRDTKTLGVVYIYIYITQIHGNVLIQLWKKVVEQRKLNSKQAKANLVLFVIQKLYIKYKKIKDGLLKIIICPFGVQKEEMSSS